MQRVRNDKDDKPLVKFPKAKLTLFMYSFGVATGRPMITTKQRLTTESVSDFSEIL